jgi:hypothetical protein
MPSSGSQQGRSRPARIGQGCPTRKDALFKRCNGDWGLGQQDCGNIPGTMHLYRSTGATLVAEIASGPLSDILSRCFTGRLGFHVHHGRAEPRVAARATVLGLAFAADPERFPPGRPPSGVPHRRLEQSAHDPGAFADITGDLSFSVAHAAAVA